MWLYLPDSTSCRFVPDAPGSTSASLLPSMLELSVTWKGKQQPPRSWSRVLKTERSTRLLFTRTFEASTVANGAGSWISSLRAIRVNRFRSPDGNAGAKTLGTCGRTLLALFERASPGLFFSRTSPTISRSDFARSPATYEQWVTGLKRDSLARRKSARLTVGNGSLSSLTATASDRHWYTPDASASDRGAQNPATAKGQGHAQRLQDQATYWPTPVANPAPRGVNFTKSDGHYKPHDLTTAVNQWPTPVANDHKSGVTGAIAHPNARPLREVACQCLHLDPMTSPDGATYSSTGRKLNPRFVELLMGLPLEWTAYELLGMESFRSWRLTHSVYLRDLLSQMKTRPRP